MNQWILTKFNTPWEHVVVDNFLPDKLFKLLLTAISKKDFTFENKKHYNNFKLDYYEQFEKKEVNDFFKQHINETFISEHFSTSRKYSNLKSHFDFQIMNETGNSSIHCDLEEKIITSVFYIYPKVNIGTSLYDINKNYIKTIDWVPNRAFIFCPLTDITWHSYKNESFPFRATLNFNLLSSN